MFPDSGGTFQCVPGKPWERGLERCLRLDGVGSIHSPTAYPIAVSKSMHCQDLLSILPQDKQRMPWPRPELLIVLEQQTGLPTILAVAKSSFIFSRWNDPSGETNPDQVITSPGIRDLRSLFTGPPSEKATSFTAFPEENTEMFA